MPDDLLRSIDTERKAYLLGWIASDGTVGASGSITIAVHERDADVLRELAGVIGGGLPVRALRRNQVSLSVSSTQMVADVCRWLAIAPGKKSRTVRFPPLATNTLRWAFLRGYFDGDGHISSLASTRTAPRCEISSDSAEMRRAIRDFCGIRCSEFGSRLEWNGNNALDFLSRLYEGASIYLSRKRDLFLDWTCWVPSLSGAGNYGKELLFRWTRTRPDAVPPFKERASDSGYDITFVRRVMQAGALEMFGTGIKVEPAYGWYFDLVPRSSIYKLGYMLANSVGVIDRAYRGEILVPLIKVDPAAPDLTLPSRVVQIIPRPIIHASLIEVGSLEETSREEKAFGSSGGHGT